MRKLMVVAALLCACGGDFGSVIAGEYGFKLKGAACVNGQLATGRMAIYESATHGLSGQYDICGGTFAAADLGGGIRGRIFDLNLFGGSILVIGGEVLPTGNLSGPASGLGPDVTFEAENLAATHGKTQPPPQNGDLRQAFKLCEVLRCAPADGDP